MNPLSMLDKLAETLSDLAGSKAGIREESVKDAEARVRIINEHIRSNGNDQSRQRGGRR